MIHLYREHRYTHSTSDKGGYRWNTDRIAETWLDDNYKKYYYRLNGDTKDRKYGDISARIELKKKLQCKSFSWYVENVHPNVEIPEEIRDENWGKNKEEKVTEEKNKGKSKEEKLTEKKPQEEK